MPRTSVQDRTQVLPFAEATDLQMRIARCFSLITDWGAALAGQFPLEDVLAILVKQTEARNIALYRMVQDTPLPVATRARTFDACLPEHSSGALARYLLDLHGVAALESGSVWLLRTLRQDPNFAATRAGREWEQRSEIKEVCLVVLEATETQVDFIEMIFDVSPRPNPDLPVTLVTQALADGWSVRTPGLITRLIRTYGRNRRTSAPQAEATPHILSPENPCALSRAEQRVCQLLITGAKAREIAEALNVSIPTVRTQMRNIYAKTETTGQVDLIALTKDQKGHAA